MSATELVDIVDDDNRVVDTVMRFKMREGKLPHRTSYIAVMDRQGRFLVEVRTLCKDYAPGMFDACVGGVMQHGEEIEASALRELQEETGINALAKNTEFYPLGTLKIMFKDQKHFFFGYLYLLIGDVITVRQSSEVSGIMMLNERELLSLADNCNYDSVVAFKEIMNRARALKILP